MQNSNSKLEFKNRIQKSNSKLEFKNRIQNSNSKLVQVFISNFEFEFRFQVFEKYLSKNIM